MIGLAFTPEQFKTLLAMIYIANTIANGHREKEYLKEYDDLEQYIFSRAGAAGFPAATWTHKVSGADADNVPHEEHHPPSRLFENDQAIIKLIDEYDHAMLDALLAERLSERDIERECGPSAKSRMAVDDYDDLLDRHAEAYEEEFEQFGLARLAVVKELPNTNVKKEAGGEAPQRKTGQ
ncbi:MAG: hypothetical protein A3D65_00035 [Candidatus Lloydbacteria bacterium RIFCSPHIGHO2_02_FULL_50_13]|uniref:Uncharacterized protein n=1 Tax=Candidatus Lloydbacteria bacterium RIFCSPHIGHO2_02_FULL_50_13 TaxID=1798661 RepID=A0A1G2DAH4_9BACT|nr:MAG: hypothetical protein A3D65_00035 [Candidatus Lloydbacteria bacterium RIFCSPHIGHO2_02_FULL_50_13]